MREVDSHESGGTFHEALKDQLGLNLVSQKGPVELLVIDQIEQPSPNQLRVELKCVKWG